MKKLLVILLSITCLSCKSQTTEQRLDQNRTQRPNILWIVTEDISPLLSFYGDQTAKTPNLDALAKESVVYDNAFAVVGVCAPTRSAIITGMYPTSIGTMHMRTGQDVMSWGRRTYNTDTDRFDLEGNQIIQYSAVIPEYVKCFPEYLRKAGYFTSNNEKTDYQFAAPVTAWDQNNGKAHWRNRQANQPFFSVFNINTTHESQVWKKADLPLTVDPSKVPVPPYFQDTETSRKDIARVYSNIELMDAEVGAILQELKDDGLYDSTIIFFYSDHGGPLPRQKRELYESGLQVPFMVKGLDGTVGRTDQMVSFVDLAPTVLNIAKVDIPEHIQGKAFMGANLSNTRQYAYGTSDRFDEYTDRSRTVYFDDFIYIQNDYPDKLWYKDVDYRKQVPMMLEMLELRNQGKLNATQMAWFSDKPKEELYNRKNDPHTLHNLAKEPKFAATLKKGQTLLKDFRTTYKDRALQPEAAMLKEMWPNFEQPSTAAVSIDNQDGRLLLSCETKGASIAYIISDKPLIDLDFDSGWQLYATPLKVEKGKMIYTIAQRIGYKESEIKAETL